MSLSLQEQLLKAGLVTEKQAKRAEQQQRQQHHQQNKHQPNPAAQKAARQAEERKQALAREQAAKIARDQELNRQRQEKAARKAMHAEIRQWVEQQRLPRVESEEFFNFIHGKKIHRMAVDAERRSKLQKGELAIVRYAPGYAVIPLELAARIRERDSTLLVDLNAKDTDATPAEDDPYSQFVVPDDLMW